MFCSCDIGLDPMTFIYEFDLYSLKIYLRQKELYVKAIESYRITHIHNRKRCFKDGKDHVM